MNAPSDELPLNYNCRVLASDSKTCRCSATISTNWPMSTECLVLQWERSTFSHLKLTVVTLEGKIPRGVRTTKRGEVLKSLS